MLIKCKQKNPQYFNILAISRLTSVNSLKKAFIETATKHLKKYILKLIILKDFFQTYKHKNKKKILLP